MLHAPISQIVNPAWESWQTARFSVFARQSRVDVDPQRELQDMLTKLDEGKSISDDGDENRCLREKRKRKFLELAVPCGALSVLCLIYCLVYISMAGSDIVASTEWTRYQDQIGDLEGAVKVILDEYKTRVTSSDTVSVPEEVYVKTDAAIHKVLMAKTLREWRLISSINDWRTQKSEFEEDNNKIVRESLFYLNFVTELQTILYENGLGLEDIGRWKLYYDYQKTSRFCVTLHIIIGIFNAFELHDTASKFTNNSVFEFIKILPKFGLFLDEIDFGGANRSLAYSYNLLSSLMHLTSPNATDEDVAFSNSETFDFIKLYIHQKRNSQYQELYNSNCHVLKFAVLTFCLSFLGLCLAVGCTVGFGYLLREESRLVVLVADWFSHLETSVDEQKKSTHTVLRQVVPRTLLSKYDTSQTMVPYQTSDTSIFMSSIAQFNSLFDLFSPAQTFKILTFVMELLDERMEQYNVFPVARMGHYLVVISDTTERRQVQHACEIANLAVDIMTCCSDLEIGRHATSKLMMKIALHSGPCTGRLVLHRGTVQLQLLGSSIEILEGIHRAATPNMIHLSESTYRLLNTCETYCLHYRGNINIQGNCKHRVYWLNGRRVSSVTAFDRESTCSRMGSWIELEKKPLYRLDNIEGTYEPVNKCTTRRYSQMSIGSYVPQVSPAYSSRCTSRQRPSQSSLA